MSDDLVGRYRRVYVRIWDDPKFRNLSPTEQRLALYLLSGPQTNRIGLFKFSISTASEDLNLGIETLRKAFGNVATSFNWIFDADARVIFMPSWWRWNSSVNTNILLGNLKDLSEIPSCGLVEAFARNLTYLPSKVHESFLEALRQRLPQSSPTTKSGTLTGKQKQEQEAALRAEVPSLRSVRSASSEKEHGHGKGSSENGLVSIAAQALQFVGRDADLDAKVDTFHQFKPKGLDVRRADVVAAITAAESVAS